MHTLLLCEVSHMLLIILLYSLFGTSFVLGKYLLKYSTPLFITGIRFALGGLILIAYQRWNGHRFSFSRSSLFWYAQMVVLGIFVTYTLRLWALTDMPAAKTNFLYNLSPFAASLFSYFMFNERMSYKKWVGLTIGCVGLLPILMSTTPLEQAVGGISFLSWPEIAVLISVITHTYSWIIMRKLIKDEKHTPIMINSISMTAGGILALFISFITEGFSAVSTTNIPDFLFNLTAIVLISNIICYNLYGYLLKRHTATFVSFAGFMGPLFTALYGWILLGETVTWHFYASSVIVFVGLYLFYQEELQDRSKQFDLEI